MLVPGSWAPVEVLVTANVDPAKICLEAGAQDDVVHLDRRFTLVDFFTVPNRFQE